MKKLLFLAACAMVAMSSCGNKEKTPAAGAKDSVAVRPVEAEQKEEVRIDTLQTDTLSFEKHEGYYTVTLFAEYPIAGSDSLVKSIREYINDFLSGSYSGSLADGRAMIRENGEYQFNVLQEEGDVDEEYAPDLFIQKSVIRGFENSAFVTFEASNAQYTGGIHGIGFETGCTFCKANGKRFDSTMLKNTNTPAFKRLIKNGLKKFFATEGKGAESVSDEALAEELVSYGGSVDELPLPDAEPFMTAEGIKFIYQPYEISYYAAGRPEFTIPYDVVKPYLTDEAIEWFLSE